MIPNKLSNLINSLKVLASETFTSVSSPIQYAAITAFENDHNLYLKKSRNILKTLGNYMFENLRSNNVLISKPQGGFYIMPEFLNKKFISAEKLCEDILDNTGVASLPGSDFGFNSHKMIIRLSFTDFDGKDFMNNILDNTNIDDKLLNKYAPKVVEGTKRLKAWVES